MKPLKEVDSYVIKYASVHGLFDSEQFMLLILW